MVNAQAVVKVEGRFQGGFWCGGCSDLAAEPCVVAFSGGMRWRYLGCGLHMPGVLWVQGSSRASAAMHQVQVLLWVD
jgi:hypothetical protein